MTPEVTAVAPISMPTTAGQPAAATLQTIEERTRAIAEVAEGLRPLIALAQQAPAFVAVVMDSFDEAMRTAQRQRHRRRARPSERRRGGVAVRRDDGRRDECANSTRCSSRESSRQARCGSSVNSGGRSRRPRPRLQPHPEYLDC